MTKYEGFKLKDLCAERVVYFSCSKAEWRQVGTTCTISPHVPIILCIQLNYTYLEVERKSARDKVCRWSSEFYLWCVQAYWFPCVNKLQKKDKRQKKKKKLKFPSQVFILYNIAINIVPWSCHQGIFEPQDFKHHCNPKKDMKANLDRAFLSVQHTSSIMQTRVWKQIKRKHRHHDGIFLSLSSACGSAKCRLGNGLLVGVIPWWQQHRQKHRGQFRWGPVTILVNELSNYEIFI